VKSNSPHYYAADIGRLHLVVMDPWRNWLSDTPDPDHEPWRKQMAWLESDLAATEQPWIVVAQHFPLYCGGDYHSDDEPLTQVRRQLLPIFDRFGVDLSLAGHDHTFQRTYLLHGLVGPSDTYDPAVHRKSPSDGRTAPITKRRGRDGGTVHVVSGMGGGSRRAETFAYPAMGPIDGALGTSRPGNLVIEIDGGVHERDEVVLNDHYRQQAIEALGWTVIRFTNAEALADPDRIDAAIRDRAKTLGL
jgi:3',5'-cyclic AMP phosphodiesterase CpdA